MGVTQYTNLESPIEEESCYTSTKNKPSIKHKGAARIYHDPENMNSKDLHWKQHHITSQVYNFHKIKISITQMSVTDKEL